jgi:hypothetical protein
MIDQHHFSRLGKRVNMSRVRAPRKRKQVHWRALARIGLASCLGCLLLPGCASLNDSRAKAGGDPLFGEKQVDRPPIGPTPPPQNRAGMNVPPGPTATASKSTAAILANPPEPLTTTRPSPALGDQATQTVGGWQPKTDGQPTSAGGPGVQLKMPETAVLQPVPPPINSQQPVPAVPSYGPAPANDTTQLLATLKSRGMVWNTQTPVAGGVRFSCGIRNSQNPNLIQAFDATAADAPSAMSAVLQKLDQPQ